jgi:hypothetical protein
MRLDEDELKATIGMVSCPYAQMSLISHPLHPAYIHPNRVAGNPDRLAAPPNTKLRTGLLSLQDKFPNQLPVLG